MSPFKVLVYSSLHIWRGSAEFGHLSSQECCYSSDCPPAFYHSILTLLSCRHTLHPRNFCDLGPTRNTQKIWLFALLQDLNSQISSHNTFLMVSLIDCRVILKDWYFLCSYYSVSKTPLKLLLYRKFCW